MFVQTQKTPNPNSLKFLPNKKVSNDGLIEIAVIISLIGYFIWGVEILWNIQGVLF